MSARNQGIQTPKKTKTVCDKCGAMFALNAVTESGEFKSYVRAAESRRTSGEIEINKDNIWKVRLF